MNIYFRWLCVKAHDCARYGVKSKCPKNGVTGALEITRKQVYENNGTTNFGNYAQKD
jgi:hypothetical protein